MARKQLTAADLLPDYDLEFEPVAGGGGAPGEAPERVDAPGGKPGKADRGGSKVAARARFVSLGDLYDQLAEAQAKGWKDKAVDLSRTIQARTRSQFEKDTAVNAILNEARARRGAVGPFVIMVGRCEALRLEHLYAGLGLQDLLEIGGGGRQPWVEGGAASTRKASDGGMAHQADKVQLRRKVWKAFHMAAEMEGLRLSERSGFGEVCCRVIRGDSGIEATLKGLMKGRISTLRDVAQSAMVAGLDAVLPMLARRK